ncbi:MAG: SufD family Fe-S cluster assembly protein [Bacilli bacterium]|nr:SufD family Fe-S cluster assembly protein [Bacilli bacterium]
MNKLEVLKKENDINLNNDNYLLEVDNEEKFVSFNVKGNNKLSIVGENCIIHLYFIFDNNNENIMTVNMIGKNVTLFVKTSLFENSKFTFNYGVLASTDSINSFEIYHIGDNSISEINNGGINLSNNKLHFNIDGKVYQSFTGVECRQNSKIINYGNGDSKIIPNLIIDTNEILASHSAYIGTIDKETKFYLESRGLTEEEINNLFVKSIILGKMELDEEASLFNEKLKEWW